jgi:hypothetical protein
MNYLQLCNAVLRELNEVEIVSVSSTRGIQSAVKDFINKSQKDIINSELEWPFTYADSTITTASGTGEYTLAADLKTIDQDTVFINLGGTKSLTPLDYLAYDEYIREYLSLNSDPNDNHLSEPSHFYITQDSKLGLYPEPDGVYTVSYQYWSTHSDMAGNTDVPVIPERFHDVIVNRAKYYAYMLRSDLQSAQLTERDYREGVTRMRVELINRKDYMRAV